MYIATVKNTQMYTYILCFCIFVEILSIVIRQLEDMFIILMSQPFVLYISTVQIYEILKNEMGKTELETYITLVIKL